MRHMRIWRYIDETARCGSLRRAAERLNITPSALQRRIQDVEEDLGTLLFERRPSGVALTAAGMTFGGQMERLELTSGGLLLYMALLSAAAFGIWSLLLKHNAVGMIAAFNFLVPIFGVVLSAIFLGESLMQWANLVALVLVSIGIGLVTRSSAALQPSPPK